MNEQVTHCASLCDISIVLNVLVQKDSNWAIHYPLSVLNSAGKILCCVVPHPPVPHPPCRVEECESRVHHASLISLGTCVHAEIREENIILQKIMMRICSNNWGYINSRHWINRLWINKTLNAQDCTVTNGTEVYIYTLSVIVCAQSRCLNEFYSFT